MKRVALSVWERSRHIPWDRKLAPKSNSIVLTQAKFLSMGLVVCKHIFKDQLTRIRLRRMIIML